MLWDLSMDLWSPVENLFVSRDIRALDCNIRFCFWWNDWLQVADWPWNQSTFSINRHLQGVTGMYWEFEYVGLFPNQPYQSLKISLFECSNFILFEYQWNCCISFILDAIFHFSILNCKYYVKLPLSFILIKAIPYVNFDVFIR